jgi:hypothetical protein
MINSWERCRIFGRLKGLGREAEVRIRDHSGVEVGPNTSTVALRVIEGDELGSLESETVKYGRESQGTRTRE